MGINSHDLSNVCGVLESRLPTTPTTGCWHCLNVPTRSTSPSLHVWGAEVIASLANMGKKGHKRSPHVPASFLQSLKRTQAATTRYKKQTRDNGYIVAEGFAHVVFVALLSPFSFYSLLLLSLVACTSFTSLIFLFFLFYFLCYQTEPQNNNGVRTSPLPRPYLG